MKHSINAVIRLCFTVIITFTTISNFGWAQANAFLENGAGYRTDPFSPVAIWVHGLSGVSDAVYIGHGNANQSSSTALGTSALTNATTSNGHNTAMGYQALLSLTSSNNNTAFGSRALEATTTGSENSSLGSWAMLSNSTGYRNTAIGRASLFRTTSAYHNTALGTFSGANFVSGNYNTFIGTLSGYNGTGSISSSGSYNAAVGSSSLNSLITGEKNTALGTEALDQLQYGSNNVAIGFQARVGVGTSGTPINNCLSIQNVIYGASMSTGANGVISIGAVPAGVAAGGLTPAGSFSKLHVGGTDGSIPSLQLDVVPTTTAAANRSYLFLDANGVVVQAPLPGGTNCNTANFIPRATGTSGNTTCSQIYDDGTNIGIALGAAPTPTAKLDIDLSNGSTPGTVRLRNLQVNGAVSRNVVLIDDNGDLWRSSLSFGAKGGGSFVVEDPRVEQLQEEVKNLRALVELMLKSNNSSLSKKQFSVYPNPVKNEVKIEQADLTRNDLKQYVEIRDINNKTFVEKTLLNQQLNVSLGEKVPAGIYFVVIYQGQDIIQTDKIVVVK